MAKKQQARLQRAKERFADAMDEMREQNDRIREDLRFSNPVAPQQWSDEAKNLRGSRPMLTFDNTNKYIFQVVNDGAASVPSIQTVPADGFAHEKAAEALNGRIRHIEYVSRAQLAYGTSLDLAARCGLGWLHVRPEVLNPETNQQEPRIIRIKNPLECVLEAGWQEPDGSDAECGWMLSTMHRTKFKRAYPKANETADWSDELGLWTTPDSIIVAQFFEVEVDKVSKLLVNLPGGERIAMTEDEYWELAQALGFPPDVEMDAKGNPVRFDQENRSVRWTKMTGCEELEDATDFPSRYIPIVPVIGNEIWIDGQRYLGGLTRQLMDGQRMHNAEMSSYTESILSQPKAPYTIPMAGIEGHEAAWKSLNSGNPSFLPYNHVDEDGNAVPGPSRISPPQMPTAFAQGAVMGTNAMSNAVGVFKSGLGQETANAVSGVAKQQDRRESNTATFHYGKNRNFSLQHLGRIIIDMERRLSDTARNVRTMAEDGTSGTLRYDPQLQNAVQMKGEKVESINPSIGEYDLRVTTGPSFLTQNEETASELSEMFRGAPELLPVLGPLWIKLKGVPDSETIRKLLIAMAPPSIKEVYAEQDKEDGEPIPAAAQQVIRKMQGQIKELSQALEAAAAEADKTQVEKDKARIEKEKVEAAILTDGYRAVTDRLKVTAPAMSMTPEFAALLQQTIRDALTIAPTDPAEMQPIPPPQIPQQQEFQPQPVEQQFQDAPDAGFDAPPEPATTGLEP